VLRRLAWSSVPSPSFSAAALDEIVASARRYNERHHVSGMMLFTGAHFLGVLEGAEWDLANLWPKLGRDERHRDLRRIGDVLCGDRWFPRWMMSRTDNAIVRAQIESLRAPEVHSPTAGWAEAIRPIMLHAGAVQGLEGH
jgi:Sensors of blue-light using FAD